MWTSGPRPPLVTPASPQAQPSKQQYEKPKRKQKAKPAKPKDDRTPNERARDDFLDEIADRGFELPSDAKHLYYHCAEGWPATRRLVMRKLVVRFETYTNGGWQLWKSFSFLHDFDDAIGALDKPGKGFAKRSWFA